MYRNPGRGQQSRLIRLVDDRLIIEVAVVSETPTVRGTVSVSGHSEERRHHISPYVNKVIVLQEDIRLLAVKDTLQIDLHCHFCRADPPDQVAPPRNCQRIEPSRRGD